MGGFGYRSIRDLERARDRRLRRFLDRQVHPFHPFYRERFAQLGIRPGDVRGVRDLERLPFTTKEDLLPTPEDPERGLRFLLTPDEDSLKQAPWSVKGPLLLLRLARGRQAVRRRLEREYKPIFMTATTGRSSRPVPFLYTLRDIELLGLAGSRILEVMDQDSRAKTVNLFPYAPHLAFWQVQLAGFARGVMVVGTGGGRVMGTQASVRLIERMRAEVIVGVPSFLYHVFRRAVRMSARLDSIRMLVLGAEKVPEGMKEKLREICAQLGSRNVVVIGTYGFTEARMAFCEDPYDEQGGYVLYPDLGVFEIVDPKTGERLPDDADGELVYTPLDGRGTVVVRYRTGDLVRGGIRYERKPRLGGYVPVLAPDISRVSNIREMRLKKVKGTLVDLNDLAALLSGRPEIEEWQVVIRKRNDDPYEVDELAILVALREGSVSDVERFKAELAEQVRTRCEVQPNAIEVLALEELVERLGLETEMKEKRFVDLRPAR